MHASHRIRLSIASFAFLCLFLTNFLPEMNTGALRSIALARTPYVERA
jgi:hypothetical protein